MTANAFSAGRRPFLLVPDCERERQEAARAGTDRPLLAFRVLDLLEAAQTHIITIASRAGRGDLSGQMAALRQAATVFELEPGQSLAMRLSTGLDQHGPRATAQPGSMHSDDLVTPASRLTLVVATDAGPRGAWFLRAPPLVCPDGMTGDFAPGGPYLVLVVSERDGLGRHRPRYGYAQPILGPDLFMPIRTGVERDVLRVLLRLQEQLDAVGADATIARRIEQGRLGAELEFSLVKPSGKRIDLGLICDGSDQGLAGLADDCFYTGLQEIADGSLVAWLNRRVLAATGPE